MESILKLGVEVYEKTGVGGLFVFFLIVLLCVVSSFAARYAKKNATEADSARKEVKEIQLEMRKQLEKQIEDCRRECDERELELKLRQETINRLMDRVQAAETSELNLRRELDNLRSRLRELEARR